MKTDFKKLETTLKALAYSTRLELLSALRDPRTVEQIRLTPGTARAGARPERPISRQAVQGHLDQLRRAGFVKARPADRAGKHFQYEYVADEAALFAASEEFRLATNLSTNEPFDPTLTLGLPETPAASWEPGPKLVLVHGAREGRSFMLRTKDAAGGRGWIIGRKTGVTVVLDYDPFVSSQHAEVLRDGQAFVLLDVRTSRNGTFLNWERLPPGGRSPLHDGDIIGVGRSRLVFRSS